MSLRVRFVVCLYACLVFYVSLLFLCCVGVGGGGLGVL